VSAPEHIIVPYREEEKISFCEQLKIKKAGGIKDSPIDPVNPGILRSSADDKSKTINPPVSAKTKSTVKSKTIVKSAPSKTTGRQKKAKEVNLPEAKAVEKPVKNVRKSTRKNNSPGKLSSDE
jgi:hypothetical protein